MSLIVAVVILALLGLASLVAALFVMAEASGAEQADDHLGAIGGALLLGAGGVLAVIGLVGIVAAVGLWRRQAWGWLAGVLTTGIVMVGTLAVISVSASEPGLVVGGLLGAAGLSACCWPGTRRACTR